MRFFKYFALFLILSNDLFCNTISFTNGKIQYEKNEGKNYYNGAVEFNTEKYNYSFPFNAMEQDMFNGQKVFKFELSEATNLNSNIFTNLTLLPESKLALYETNKKITGIIIEDAIVGDPKSTIRYRNVISIDNIGAVVQKSGSIELGPLNFSATESDHRNNMVANFGAGNVVQFQLDNYVWEPDFTKFIPNLSPVIKLDGGLQISQTKIHGEIEYGFTLLDHPIEIGGIVFPSFLTKENPFIFRGSVDYNGITDVFHMHVEKEYKSGSMLVNGQKDMKVLFKATRFGFKYTLNGTFSYDLTNLKLWLKNNPTGEYDDFILKNKLTPEDWLGLKVIEKFYSIDEIKQYDFLEFKGLVGLRIFYDPDEADKAQEDVEWKTLEPIIKIESRQTR